MNQPVIRPIHSIRSESETVKTIFFEFDETVLPGQFFMIWIPGVDEIPMSVSCIQPEIKGITFKVVGEATKALFSLKNNDLIGIRGPYGNGFSFQGDHHLFVGGGTGIAMIAPAVEACLQKNNVVDVVLGAQTKQDLFFVKRLEKSMATVYITTDDGSEGYKGYASDLVRKLLKDQTYDMIYTCGPELMMTSIFNECEMHHIPLQASLERYMKCAVGLCGQCCIGEGLRVCVEGPIFTYKQLEQIKDFGMFTRDASGQKLFFNKKTKEELQ